MTTRQFLTFSKDLLTTSSRWASPYDVRLFGPIRELLDKLSLASSMVAQIYHGHTIALHRPARSADKIWFNTRQALAAIIDHRVVVVQWTASTRLCHIPNLFPPVYAPICDDT